MLFVDKLPLSSVHLLEPLPVLLCLCAVRKRPIPRHP